MFLIDSLTPAHYLAIEEVFRDAYWKAGARSQPDDRVAIVDVDEASLAAAGPWPWPRSRLADLAEILLGDYGARAVGFDMVLPERGDPDGDARMAALAQHGRLVVAQALDFAARSPQLAVGKLAGAIAAGEKATGVPATGFIANHAGLSQASFAGNIGVRPDPDGQIRKLPLLTRWGDQTYPTLSLAMLLSAGIRTPAPAEHFWRIPFRYAPSSFLVVSAHEVLAGNIPEKLLKDRLILVGSSALGLADRAATPLDPVLPGVMVHAEALTGLLDDLQTNTASLRWLAWAWIFASVPIIWLVARRYSAWWVMLALAAFVVGWSLLAWRCLAVDPDFPLLAPVPGYAILLLFSVPVEWWRGQREIRRLRLAFGHYVAPHVLNALVQTGGEKALLPRQGEVTTLVADMVNYTGMVERLSLADAVGLTRGFLEYMTPPVLAEGGTLDKYTGDGLMAFFGAPLETPDHADRAVAAACGMMAGLQAFNREREAAGLPPVQVRIGVESGRAIAGDLGTTFRSTYTAVGDSVNVAAKLQAMARDIGVSVLIGPRAAGLVQVYQLRFLGEALVPGRTQAEGLYTLADAVK